MHALFPRVSIAAILSCAVVMYVTMVHFDLKIAGYIIGFMTRFGVEFVLEGVHLYRNFPPQVKVLPSSAEIRDGLGAMMRFSFLYAVGFSSEIVIFEFVPFILFQSAQPVRNIALWMSLCQIISLCTSEPLRPAD